MKRQSGEIIRQCSGLSQQIFKRDSCCDPLWVYAAVKDLRPQLEG